MDDYELFTKNVKPGTCKCLQTNLAKVPGRYESGGAFRRCGEGRLDLRRKPMQVADTRRWPIRSAITSDDAGSSEGAKTPVRRDARTV